MKTGPVITCILACMQPCSFAVMAGPFVGYGQPSGNFTGQLIPQSLDYQKPPFLLECVGVLGP
jgi:hypothetical protein